MTGSVGLAAEPRERTGEAERAGDGPRYPLEGVVSWNMNTTCNYRCSYCTQRFVDDRAQWARDLSYFVDGFNRLVGDWEIKLSGGEPFRHPRFLEAVTALAAHGRRVSVVTNLSASCDELAAFAEVTARRPGVISASLHLEHVSASDFADKAVWLAERHRGSLLVNCVATRALLPRLAPLKAQFEAAGLAFRVQPEKQDREVIDYAPHERERLLALGGHNGTGLIAPSFEGQRCWAGSRYWIVDHRGEAYRCYPARRYRKEYLGNVVAKSLALRSDAEPCPYSYCNCTVPQQRGMVTTR